MKILQDIWYTVFMKYALVFLILWLTTIPRLTYAQAPPITTPEQAKAEVVSTIDDTPYRGILPDSPFYKLHIFWNRLQLRLTPNLLKQTEKYVQFATNELEAAEEMLTRGNEALALHTALRGEHYMTRLVDNTKSHAYYGGDVDPKIFELAHEVYPSHQKLLDRMIAKASPETQKTLSTVKEFSTRNDTEMKKLEADIMEITPPNTAQ